jgi:geranylgeranyl pyrophosphate synthase
VSSAETVTAVIEAGGAHVPPLMERIEVRLRAIAAAHGEALGHHAVATIEAGGKRLRPLLVLLAAGRDTGEGLVRAGVAVELVHSASLVHDDVLDRAPLRRGRPTVAAEGGPAMATAVGDLLFSQAFAELVDSRREDEVRALSGAASALARGELLQREDAFDLGISRERYLERCDFKTGRLFRAACELGALEAGGPVETLGRFGTRIGLAFQLLDDVLDVSGPAERTGKHRGTDLLDGTVTLPLIIARERGLEPRRVATPAEAEALCDDIAATGALEEARAQAHALVRDAKAELDGLPEAQRAALHLVADGVVDRYA